MSTLPKPPKRRIIPTVIHDEKQSIGNIESRRAGTEAQQKHYENILKIEQKYVKHKASTKHTEHGTHWQHLHSFQEYLIEFCKLKKHNKTQTMYDYLKNNFDKGLYYSTKTKRFRRYR